MSRYAVNKVLRELTVFPENMPRFKDDTAGYLAGRDLTDEERRALETFDYRTLYSLGAHPFLLNGFVMKLWPGDRRTMFQEYSATIAPLGYPDFGT